MANENPGVIDLTKSSTKEVQIVDNEKASNSIISSIFEMEDTGDDEHEEGTEPKVVDKKDEKKTDVVEEIELEEVDITDSTDDEETEEAGEETNAEEEETEEASEATVETTEEAKIEIKTPSPEMVEAQLELKQAARDINRLNKVFNQRPEAPKADASEHEVERYERKLEAWEDKCLDNKAEIESLQESSRESALRIQNGFLAAHKELAKDATLLSEFNQFLTATPLGQSMYLGVRTGDMNIEEAYDFWTHKSGKIAQKLTAKVQQDLKNKKVVKITKPVSIESSTDTSVTKQTKGSNGYPKEFAYLNKPELKDFVALQLSARSPITGRKRTPKEVNEYAKAEWLLMKNKS